MKPKSATRWANGRLTKLAQRRTNRWELLQDKLQTLWRERPLLGRGLLLGAGFLLLLIITLCLNLAPRQPWSREQQLIDLKYGTSVREVAQLLESRQLIRSRRAFEIYLRASLARRVPQAGRYQLSPGMSTPRIVGMLCRGETISILVTIPEGLTVKEIATLLEEQGVVSRAEFLDQVGNQQLVSEVLGDLAPRTWPEGYFFPDSYRFPMGVSATEIARAMLQRFRQVYQANFSQVLPGQRRELLIIASLVEKEAKRAKERPLVAAVFYNRLRLGYPLQSCATVEYILPEHKEQLSYRDLRIKSPYNTYLHSGLPPGPIANPGLAALQAAATPAEVGYLYFVAKPDGSHVFSNTFEQHLRAQQEIERSQN